MGGFFSGPLYKFLNAHPRENGPGPKFFLKFLFRQVSVSRHYPCNMQVERLGRQHCSMRRQAQRGQGSEAGGQY